MLKAALFISPIKLRSFKHTKSLAFHASSVPAASCTAMTGRCLSLYALAKQQNTFRSRMLYYESRTIQKRILKNYYATRKYDTSYIRGSDFFNWKHILSYIRIYWYTYDTRLALRPLVTSSLAGSHDMPSTVTHRTSCENVEHSKVIWGFENVPDCSLQRRVMAKETETFAELLKLH